MSPWSRPDWIIAAALAIAGAMLGYVSVNAFVRAGFLPQYYQGEFAPAVSWACGHGFVVPPASDGLAGFLQQQRESFDCGELPPAFTGREPGVFQGGHFYLLMAAASVWSVAGVSWGALTIISAAFSGVSTALVYLAARVGLGRALALLMASVWMVSPAQLSQLPHLRDYAKVPFFVFTVGAMALLAMVRMSRTATIAVMAGIGVVLGIGFGMRTDVASYLPLALIAVAVCRPGLDRHDAVTRAAAMVAAIAGFGAAAAPILSAYQTGNNVAHVALLGLTDPFRESLGVSEPSYSHGYLYNDRYLATVLGAYAERSTNLAEPLTIGTRAYDEWGRRYYWQILREFCGDMLTRGWAAVLAVHRLSFEQLQRPSWMDAAFEPLFAFRRVVLQSLQVVPPLAAAALLAVGLAARSVRLCGLFLLLAVVMPATLAVQFQSRHMFHLELVPLLTYGCVLQFAWLVVRRRWPWRGGVARAVGLKAAVATVALAVATVGSLAVARLYQSAAVTRLYAAYEAAEALPFDAAVGNAEPGAVVFWPTPLEPAGTQARFVDTNVLKVRVGGRQCDDSDVAIRFRYHVTAPSPDLTRTMLVPVEPKSAGLTDVIFPVYTSGLRSTTPLLRFVGVEVPANQRGCLQSVEKLSRPERFPLLLESILLPDGRRTEMYEKLTEVERSEPAWRRVSHSAPPDLPLSLYAPSRLAPLQRPTLFTAGQVRRLDDERVEIEGAAETQYGYLVVWPDEPRPRGSAFFVEGEVIDGGLTVGVQQNQQWVRQVNVIRPSRFRAVVGVDADGAYRAVIANHQLHGLHNRTTITRYGWTPPSP